MQIERFDVKPDETVETREHPPHEDEAPERHELGVADHLPWTEPRREGQFNYVDSKCFAGGGTQVKIRPTGMENPTNVGNRALYVAFADDRGRILKDLRLEPGESIQSIVTVPAGATHIAIGCFGLGEGKTTLRYEDPLIA